MLYRANLLPDGDEVKQILKAADAKRLNEMEKHI